MPILQHTFSFDSSLDGWTIGNPACSRTSVDGHPSLGCIQALISGRNAGGNGNIVLNWQGTLESLGVPSKAIVSRIDINFYDRMSDATVVSTATWSMSVDGNIILTKNPTGVSAWTLNQQTVNVLKGFDEILSLSLSGSLRTGNNNNAIGGLRWDNITLNIHYEIQSTPPDIIIVDYSSTKISRVSGLNVCEVVFTSNQDLVEWEARADGESVGQGLLVGSGYNLSSNVDCHFDVRDDELTWGDKQYRIKVYGKNREGIWSN